MITLDVATKLVGDLGGTHVRLGLCDSTGLLSTSVLRWDAIDDLASAVSGFLGERTPKVGCLAVAAPVDGTQIRLTNADVAFCSEDLREALGLERLLVVNDVAALARSVTDLHDDDATELGGGPLLRDKTVAVVAPGTGLGVAALLATRHGPVVVAGEGGQIPLPATVLGLPVAQAMLPRYGHVSAEDVVCGGGLPVLDMLLRSAVGSEIRPRPRSATTITASEEIAPGQVLDVFVDLLAAVAQTHALTLGARGGVVLSGGFLPQLVPLLRETGFRDRFVRHPKMGEYLSAVPIVVDTRHHPALVGAARLLEDLS